MQLRHILSLLFLSVITFTSCVENQSDPDLLATWMTGSFSSQEQAEADTSYYDIRLEMVRIWEAREDGYWIYIEQAAASKKHKPYRQRVYHLTANEDHTLQSDVYEIPDPLRFAGDWKKENPLSGLTPDSLIARKGCSVIIRRTDQNTFEGGTVGRNCRSELYGASYATSDVKISADRFISWDRGFDSEDKQVWGAEKGPYVFKKKKNIY